MKKMTKKEFKKELIKIIINDLNTINDLDLPLTIEKRKKDGVTYVETTLDKSIWNLIDEYNKQTKLGFKLDEDN